MSKLESICNTIRNDVIQIHLSSPECRIASALSSIEIFVALYYGNVLSFSASNPKDPSRDRLIVSKSHGAIPLYPILADKGFFPKERLETLGQDGETFSIIPDPSTPGIETVNGSLGHGPGVAAGMALALKKRGSNSSVFVLIGDGELSEGSIWEALSFASKNELDNLNIILDCNQKSMLDYCHSYYDMESIPKRFSAFGFDVSSVDGHDADELAKVLRDSKKAKKQKPKVIIAQTIKGRGFKKLERSNICHVLSLNENDILRENNER